MSASDPLEQARADCLRYLARRDYSRSELLQKLKVQGCEESVAGQAIAELAAEGLQSDRRFLDGFVRGRVAKGYGEMRIRQELHYKGIARDDMEECLRCFDWDEVLGEVYEKKYGQDAPASPKDRAARLRFLQHRGFAVSAINGLFRRLRHDDD